MSEFTLAGGIITEPPVRLTDNTATTVFTTNSAVPISSIIICPTSGTPTYTITQVDQDGTSRNVWKGTSPDKFNEVFVLPLLNTLKVISSSASGDLDVFVTHGIPQQGPRPGAA